MLNQSLRRNSCILLIGITHDVSVFLLYFSISVLLWNVVGVGLSFV
jgi:hypothetical protein